MRRIAFAFLASSIAAAVPDAASSSPIVVPNALESSEGDWRSSVPFFFNSIRRYQQVFDQSEFAGTIQIGRIALRPDVSCTPPCSPPDPQGPFSVTLSDVEVLLSTTSAAPDALSTTFSANVGVDETVVFHGPATFTSSATGPAGGPKAFDILLDLDVLFPYDPSLGNLLLEVRNFGTISSGNSPRFVDGASATGDPISRLTASGASDATGSASSAGVVALFAVPEPASALLVAVGLAALAARRRQA